MQKSNRLIFEPVNVENIDVLKGISVSAEQRKLLGDESDIVVVALETIKGRIVKPYIIIFEREIVGFFRLILSPEKDLCSLSAFIISEDFQGKGIGNQSLAIIIERVEDDFPDVTYLDLIVNSMNLAAINLYKKHGFVHVGKWREDFEIMQKIFPRKHKVT